MNKRIKKKIEKRARELAQSQEMTVERAFDVVCGFLIEKGLTFGSIFGECVKYNSEDNSYDYQFQIGGYGTPVILKSQTVHKKKNL